MTSDAPRSARSKHRARRPPVLAEIRAELASELSDRRLRALQKRLRQDRRIGARSLLDRLERRLDERRRERSRVSRLMRRRNVLVRAGARLIAGVDEVGMGPLAGPVVAAAVVLPERPDLPGLGDSKRLTRATRERLDGEIRRQALALGIGEVSPAEIDRRNIYRAGLEAMRRAVLALGVEPDHLLVDARTVPIAGVEQTALIGGDASDGNIAAASIVAKVHRDAMMRRIDRVHPGYGFARHVGYATREHLSALAKLGPCSLHRRSFAPVASAQAPLLAPANDASSRAARP